MIDWLGLAGTVLGALVVFGIFWLVARRVRTGRFVGPVPARDDKPADHHIVE